MSSHHLLLIVAATIGLALPPAVLGSPYLGQHAIGPLGLKEGDAPLDEYERQYSMIHKYKHKNYHRSKYLPPHKVLQSEASDELPVQSLAFLSDIGPNPSKKDLHPKRLKDLLGAYDSRFHSQVKPLDYILRPNGTLVYRFKHGKPTGRMPREFRKLQFHIPERRTSIHIKSKRARRKLKEFLWAYSYCPVLYRWRNLGPRFWPRWIKEGSCYSERSCSYPAGMTCQSKGKVLKEMLYWHCSNNPNHCNWIVFQYPIVTECTCSC